MTDDRLTKAEIRTMQSREYPDDIWASANRLAKWIDPDEVLETDPRPIIAFVLHIERCYRPEDPPDSPTSAFVGDA